MRTSMLVTLLFLLIFSNSSHAQFRCGTHLVSRGDSKEEVLEKCGPPTAVQRFGAIGHDHHYDFGDPEYNPADQGITEEWVYNFGNRRFKQYLRFESGMLEETRNLGYGK